MPISLLKGHFLLTVLPQPIDGSNKTLCSVTTGRVCVSKRRWKDGLCVGEMPACGLPCTDCNKRTSGSWNRPNSRAYSLDKQVKILCIFVRFPPSFRYTGKWRQKHCSTQLQTGSCHTSVGGSLLIIINGSSFKGRDPDKSEKWLSIHATKMPLTSSIWP